MKSWCGSMLLTEKDKEILVKYKFGNRGLSHKKFMNISEDDKQYLINRFIDTDNYKEAWYRLKLQIEERPICKLPGCNCFCEFTKMKLDNGKPTIYNKYCCYEHSRLATGSKVSDKLNSISRKPDVQYVNDETVKSIIVYNEDGKLNWFELQKIPQNVYTYILSRYSDSESFEESLIRILANIEHRPTCHLEGCNNLAKFIGADFRNNICKFTECCCQEHASKYISLKLRNRILAESNGEYSHPMQLPKNIEKLKTTLAKRTQEEQSVITSKMLATRANWTKKYKQEIQNKKEETCLEHTGYKFGIEKPEAIKLARKNNHTELAEKKRKETFFSKTGYNHVSQTPEWKKNQIKIMSSPEMQERVYRTKVKNGTFNTSKDEEYLYNILKNKFVRTGINIVRNYRTKLYPYRCDFVIIPCKASTEKDFIYIEYQGHQSHYNYPYTGSEEDKVIVNEWKRKFEESSGKKKQYIKYINVWTIKDPEKRRIAKENGLKWFEFFKVEDMINWIETLKLDDYLTSNN